MSLLSSKSEQEISQLLDEYGIKHGPIVGSTRALYEKKLKEAMAKDKGDSKVKSSPDKTYYREEAEEVTYVTYRSPIHEDSGDRTSYMRSRPAYSERDFVDEKPYSRSSGVEYSGRDFSNEPLVYDTPSSYRNVSYSKPTAVKSVGDTLKGESGSTRLIPLWVQILVFLLVAGFLYLVFTNMESDTSDPFKRLQ
ncbi:emerin-like [Osmerus mordax]|uniref:emerin-like n=1 Tax=Osmerus mordax TaxID=8014 RepID=UPI00350FE835